MGKKFGDANDPLLVSVRSGAPLSMPGMMETILNLGLNDQSVDGLAAKTGNPRFAYDAYRRFIQMYGTTAMGLVAKNSTSLRRLKNMLQPKALNLAAQVKINDTDVAESELKELLSASSRPSTRRRWARISPRTRRSSSGAR